MFLLQCRINHPGTFPLLEVEMGEGWGGRGVRPSLGSLAPVCSPPPSILKGWFLTSTHSSPLILSPGGLGGANSILGVGERACDPALTN